VQFGGNIQAHNPQKVDAEFWSACRKLSHVAQLPLCKTPGTASHYVRWTGQTTVGARIPDELTGSNFQSGVAAENSFEVSSDDDHSFGNLLALPKNDLPGEHSTHRARLANLKNSRLSIELNAAR